MSRFRVSKKEPYEYSAPDIGNLVKCIKEESLFVFGSIKEDKNYRYVLGVGYVGKIVIGDSFDVVYMSFGKCLRQIIVYKNHARRQIYGLKKGQLATFYGIYRAVVENGKPKLVFYARGFNPWYVPKAMDIKKADKESFEELQVDDEKSMLNLIDELIGG